jgi:hypothetical protein
LLNCSLNYEPLTVPQFQARIQACLDRTRNRAQALAGGGQLVPARHAAGWRGNHRRHAGCAEDRAPHHRAFLVRPLAAELQGHQAGRHQARYANPAGGKFVRDDKGNATGLLEDAAQDRP